MIRLNDVQLKQLAEFTSNLGLVFAAAVIAPLFSNIDGLTVSGIILGLTGSASSVAFSLLIIKGVKI